MLDVVDTYSIISSIHFPFNVNIAGGQSEMIGIFKLMYITHILQLVFTAPELEEKDCACPTPWTGLSPTRHQLHPGTVVHFLYQGGGRCRLSQILGLLWPGGWPDARRSGTGIRTEVRKGRSCYHNPSEYRNVLLYAHFIFYCRDIIRWPLPCHMHMEKVRPRPSLAAGQVRQPSI